MGVLVASLAVSAMAQEKFEQGKPNDDNYRYLDEYKGLKEYIDKTKYPNFKLGIGTTVPDYLKKSTVYELTNKNFTETVAGNAMKMASCVNNNGDMNFTTVKNYVKAATEAGLSVYGHTLAWHSQQPVGWLTSLIADKPDPCSESCCPEVTHRRRIPVLPLPTGSRYQLAPIYFFAIAVLCMSFLIIIGIISGCAVNMNCQSSIIH